jgi:hypothetical protein
MEAEASSAVIATSFSQSEGRNVHPSSNQSLQRFKAVGA